jgi:hypothetical protein
MNVKNEIPIMTHPLSSAWDQPKRSEITLDDNYAMMNKKTFEDLAEYSCSMPSGVYEGKMWKRIDWQSQVPYFFWYGLSEKEGHCSINSREIIVI